MTSSAKNILDNYFEFDHATAVQLQNILKSNEFTNFKKLEVINYNKNKNALLI